MTRRHGTNVGHSSRRSAAGSSTSGRAAAPAQAPPPTVWMVPVFLGGLRWEWWRRYKNDPSKRHPGDAEYAVSFWLLDVAREKNGDIVDNITVKFEQKENSLFGTAYFHGKGDAPFNAAKRMYCKGAAFDPFLPGKVKMHSAVSKKSCNNGRRSVSVTRVCTHRFSEVKEHNGYHAVRKAREAEKAMEAAA